MVVWAVPSAVVKEAVKLSGQEVGSEPCLRNLISSTETHLLCDTGLFIYLSERQILHLQNKNPNCESDHVTPLLKTLQWHLLTPRIEGPIWSGPWVLPTSDPASHSCCCSGSCLPAFSPVLAPPRPDQVPLPGMLTAQIQAWLIPHFT